MSIHAMFPRVRSLNSRSVVWFNAWTEVCVCCVTLFSMLPVRMFTSTTLGFTFWPLYDWVKSQPLIWQNSRIPPIFFLFYVKYETVNQIWILISNAEKHAIKENKKINHSIHQQGEIFKYKQWLTFTPLIQYKRTYNTWKFRPTKTDKRHS